MAEPHAVPSPASPPASNVVTLNAAVLPPAPAAITADETPDKGGGGPGGGAPAGLPADCPVTPLGMSADGKSFFYLDAGQRLCVLREKDHSRLGILALFNQRWNFLMEAWPRLSKVKDAASGEVEYVATGWKPERAAEELIAGCGRKGTLNVADRVRGAGAWRGPATEGCPQGELILHCGERVLVGRQWRPPGEIGPIGKGIIYPAQAPTPLPSELIALGGEHGPAGEARALFRHWNWKRKGTDEHLFLGLVGAAILGGALKWRPTCWVTGDYGSGKSTLLVEYLGGLLGEGGAHVTVDATPAGIWQRTRYSSHPVIVDEAETEQDGRRVNAMVKLARAASSGGVVFRGGSEHAPIQFIIQGVFVFGSILVPPLTPQDRSRITVLELERLEGIKPPAISAEKMRAMGGALIRRMVDGWDRLAAIFEAYREALAGSGHSPRSADQHGILLACADVLLWDHQEVDSDTLALWCEALPPEAGAAKDHENCLSHLVTAPIDPYRGGGRKTVMQWIEEAMLPGGTGPDPCAEANKILETYGLSVELGRALAVPRGWLYVANTHRGLAQLFEGSHWAGLSGTSSPWVQALRRIPGAEKADGKRFAGYKSRATRIPLDYLLDDDPPAAAVVPAGPEGGAA